MKGLYILLECFVIGESSWFLSRVSTKPRRWSEWCVYLWNKAPILTLEKKLLFSYSEWFKGIDSSARSQPCPCTSEFKVLVNSLLDSEGLFALFTNDFLIQLLLSKRKITRFLLIPTPTINGQVLFF